MADNCLDCGSAVEDPKAKPPVVSGHGCATCNALIPDSALPEGVKFGDKTADGRVIADPSFVPDPSKKPDPSDRNLDKTDRRLRANLDVDLADAGVVDHKGAPDAGQVVDHSSFQPQSNPNISPDAGVVSDGGPVV